MKKTIDKKETSTPIKLIWMNIFLGLGAGIIMLGILSFTVSNIHSKGEKLGAFQANITHMITSLDSYLTQARDDVGGLLLKKDVTYGDDKWIQDSIQLIDSYRDFSVSNDSGITQVIKKISNHIHKLAEIRNLCKSWNSEIGRIDSIFPVTQKAATSALEKMRANINTIEGRQRLQKAIKIRRYLKVSKIADPGSIKLANEIVKDVGRGSEIVNVKTEIADLTLLCEQLWGEDQIDNLTDLKDNRFKSTLERLRRAINILDKREFLKDVQFKILIDKFETLLFGDGFKIDDVHQTIIPRKDGLYLLCEERLKLRSKKEILQEQVTSLFDEIRQSRQQLVLRTEMVANQTAQSTETALRKSWMTMLFIWVFTTAIFLLLSLRIARTIKRQIRAIETTNKELKTEIFERKRVEDALRLSQNALENAKSELETRVEERTYELKKTNERLGKEVAIRTDIEKKLRYRGKQLANALKSARTSQRTSEAERDKSEKMLAEMTESKRRLEILLSDATTREKRMVDLKREINDLLISLGKKQKYHSPDKVDEFLLEQDVIHLRTGKIGKITN